MAIGIDQASVHQKLTGKSGITQLLQERIGLLTPQRSLPQVLEVGGACPDRGLASTDSALAALGGLDGQGAAQGWPIRVAEQGVHLFRHRPPGGPDPATWPEWLRVKTTFLAEKTAIMAALKAGQEITAAQLISRRRCRPSIRPETALRSGADPLH